MSVFTSHHPHYPSSEAPFGPPTHLFDSTTLTASSSSFHIVNPNPALASLPSTSTNTSQRRQSMPVTKYVKAEKGEREKADAVAREFEMELEREARRARREEVWKEVLGTAKGRDKVFKVIQYAMRVYLLLHTRSVNAVLAQGRHKARADQLVTNLHSAMGSISLSRKVTIMFNWLDPLLQITSPPTLPFPVSVSASFTPTSSLPTKPSPPSLLHRLLHAPPPLLLTLLNGIFDDLSTLSLLRLLPSSLGRRAQRAAQWCWFLSSLASLVEIAAERGMVRQLMRDVQERIYAGEVEGKEMEEGCEDVEEGERELERLRGQMADIGVRRWKAVCDLVFVSYELFKLKRAREPVQAVTGLLSGVFSTMTLYEQQKQSLLKGSSRA